MRTGLANSLAIALPATIIPIGIAAFAAYAFAWIDFKGRQTLFIATVALLAIPLQIALIPLLQLYNFGAHLTIPWLDKTITVFPDLGLTGTTNAVWLSHTAFGMPFAIFLLHNYISSLPRDLFEAARIDGADHFKIFWRLVLPLSVPVLAAFAIFQFLWTWNDYLVAAVHDPPQPGGLPDDDRHRRPGVGAFGQSEYLLTAGAFIQAAVPAGRVLPAPALLRPRHPRRQRQGLITASVSACVTARSCSLTQTRLSGCVRGFGRRRSGGSRW